MFLLINFKLVTYCVESLTNQVDTQLTDWLQRSSFDHLMTIHISYYYSILASKKMIKVI